MTRTAPAPVFTGGGTIATTTRHYRDPGPGELLLAPRANALCGTDRAFFHDGAAHVPGHETAGVVVAAGAGTGTPVGARGVVFLMDYCGQCRSCRLGATNQCSAKRADMGIDTDGGYGPWELVHESNFFPVTDDVDLPTATMLLDVMGTSGHALGRAELVRPDIESVYIAGAGPIGLGLLVMARLRYGPDLPVHISDVRPWRRDFAASFGGRPVDPTSPGDLRQVGRPDVAFDSSGRQAARRQALDLLGQRGALVCVGHGETVTLTVSDDLIAPERAVLGSEYFRYDELAGNLALLRAHRDVVSRVITHTLPIEELPRAYELFFGGETGKVVVTRDGAA
jgi:threonine dehydrogenase-like Zn-dependent dehydrogenase